MGEKTIRLGSAISFDTEKELDIISKIEDLSGRHKLGGVISNLLRIAFDSPEKLNNQKELVQAMEELQRYGMTYGRYEFFSKISKTIEDMKHKVDAMYEMNLKLLTLAQFGKHMGLEPKTNNMLMAQFVLEQQLTEICSTLGIIHAKHIFSSNKIQEVNEKSVDILKYIIETYDNIIAELQQNIFKQVELKINNVEHITNNSSIDNKPSTLSSSVQKEATTSYTTNNKTDDPIIKNDIPLDKFDDSTNKEEFIDFGEADLDALATFMGA